MIHIYYAEECVWGFWYLRVLGPVCSFVFCLSQKMINSRPGRLWPSDDVDDDEEDCGDRTVGLINGHFCWKIWVMFFFLFGFCCSYHFPPIWFGFLKCDFSYLFNISKMFLDISTVLPDYIFGLRPPHFPLHLPTWSGFRESGISNLGFGPKWNYLSSGPLHNGRLTVSISKILLEFYGIFSLKI